MIVIVAAFAVLSRSQLARWIGITTAPYYPVWSLAYVIVGVLVIYGLAAHGGRRRVV